ncbi:MAG: hypothetical protein OJF49_002289 [Ktedonobacterales bacterium]|nr:MAG: hypothetical protein OJF49_002289 [Ktedonobacterales bacterium]
MWRRGRAAKTERMDVPDLVEDDMDEQTTDGFVREDLDGKSRSRLSLRMPQSIAGMSPGRRRILYAALALLVVLIFVFVFILRQLAPAVHYATVAQGNLTISFPATGTLQSAEYDPNFAITGQVAEIDVTVGDTVTAGQTLAKLNTTQLQNAVNAAQAAVNAAQTKFDDANASLNKVQAQTDAALAAAYDAEQAKLNSSNCDSACVQQAEDQYAAAQALADAQNAAAQTAVDDAQSEVNTSKALLQIAQGNLAAATLTAPHDGTVAAIYGTVGGGAGGSAVPFIKIVDLGAMQMQANVSVAHAGDVARGQIAQVTVPAIGKQIFQGTVTSVSPLGTVIGNTLTYPVTIDLDTANTTGAAPLPGMAAQVAIVTAQRFAVLLIPVSAVTFAQAASDLKHGGFLTAKQVTAAMTQARNMLTTLENEQGADISQDQPTPSYVLENANGKWVVKPVVLGLTNGKSYEVLAGLKAGEKIVSGEANSGLTFPTPTPVITR